MPSEVDIANRALTKIGAKRITSLSDPTPEAALINSLFDIVRDAELRSAAWRFAMKRAKLPALATAPEFGYSYAYQLPADCVRVYSVGEDFPSPPSGYTKAWEVEGRTLLSDDAAPLPVRYVASISDPTLFDPLFVECLACRLAVETAEPLTQSGNKRELAWKEYRLAKREAVRLNAIELPPQAIPDDTWLLARV